MLLILYTTVGLALADPVQEALALVPRAPEQADRRLAAVERADAPAWRAWLRMSGHIGTGGWDDEVVRLLATAGIDLQRGASTVEVLRQVRFVTGDDVVVPCHVFADHAEARMAFGSYFGSSKDISPDICRPSIMSHDDVRDYLSSMFVAAYALEPGPCGTMAISEARQTTVDLVAGVLRPADLLARASEIEVSLSQARTWAASKDRGWNTSVVSREEARAALLTAMVSPDAGAAASLWLDLAESDGLTQARRCNGE